MHKGRCQSFLSFYVTNFDGAVIDLSEKALSDPNAARYLARYGARISETNFSRISYVRKLQVLTMTLNTKKADYGNGFIQVGNEDDVGLLNAAVDAKKVKELPIWTTVC